MQDHRHPTDMAAWTIYAAVMITLVGTAIAMSAGLRAHWIEWVLALFGAAIIGSLISLAVLPSLRHR